MHRRKFLQNVAVVGASAVTAGCDWPFTTSAPRKNLLIAGSTAVEPFVKLLADAFVQLHKDVDIVTEGGGTVSGLIAVRRGAIDIATMSRDLTFDEVDLDIHNALIGIDGLAIVVHRQSPVSGLAIDQIRAAFEGGITNWKNLGGPDAPVTLYSRKEGSATRKGLEEFVLAGGVISRRAKQFGKADELSKALAADPNGLGYLATRDLDGSTKALAVSGVAIDAKTLMLGEYPLRRDMFLVLSGEASALGAEFVAFSLSPRGQKLLADNGLVRVR